MQEAAWTSVPSPPSSDSDIARGTATAEAHHAPSAMKWDRNIAEKPWGEDKILSEQGGKTTILMVSYCCLHEQTDSVSWIERRTDGFPKECIMKQHWKHQKKSHLVKTEQKQNFPLTVKTQGLRTAQVHAPYLRLPCTNDVLFLQEQHFTSLSLQSTDYNIIEIKERMKTTILPNARCLLHQEGQLLLILAWVILTHAKSHN